MPKKRLRTLHIRDPRQLRAIRTPLRQELLQTVISLGTASVKALSEATGRPPASLYYHVHELEAAGLIARAERRPSGGRPEATYRAVADRILVDRDVRSPAFAKALADLHRATLNKADREIADALRRERIGGAPEGEAVVLLRLSACLSKADAQEARRRLHELAEFMGERRQERGEEELALTAAMVRLK
ncbi:MAG: helix-turn-helix transcriptional regulator [Candidatus Eisenbacteria bacterium]|nr:helix-turn-helix transcriptional regulator [Candidatus Eisenbacteria bacterium]